MEGDWVIIGRESSKCIRVGVESLFSFRALKIGSDIRRVECPVKLATGRRMRFENIVKANALRHYDNPC